MQTSQHNITILFTLTGDSLICSFTKLNACFFCFPSNSLGNAVISVLFEVSTKQITHPFTHSTNRTLVPTTFKARGGEAEGHKDKQAQVEALESRTGAKEDT